MGTRIHCPFSRCTIRRLMGPAVLITIGLLLLLQETGRGSAFHINNTYPVILIVMGAILLASALAPMTGHVYAPLPPGPPSYVPPAPGSHPPAPPSSSSGQGR